MIYLLQVKSKFSEKIDKIQLEQIENNVFMIKNKKHLLKLYQSLKAWILDHRGTNDYIEILNKRTFEDINPKPQIQTSRSINNFLLDKGS